MIKNFLIVLSCVFFLSSTAEASRGSSGDILTGDDYSIGLQHSAVDQSFRLSGRQETRTAFAGPNQPVRYLLEWPNFTSIARAQALIAKYHLARLMSDEAAETKEKAAQAAERNRQGVLTGLLLAICWLCVMLNYSLLSRLKWFSREQLFRLYGTPKKDGV